MQEFNIFYLFFLLLLLFILEFGMFVPKREFWPSCRPPPPLGSSTMFPPTPSWLSGRPSGAPSACWDRRKCTPRWSLDRMRPLCLPKYVLLQKQILPLLNSQPKVILLFKRKLEKGSYVVCRLGKVQAVSHKKHSHHQKISKTWNTKTGH